MSTLEDKRSPDDIIKEEVTAHIYRMFGEEQQNLFKRFDPLDQMSEETKVEMVFNLNKIKNPNNNYICDKGIVDYTKEIHAVGIGGYIQTLAMFVNVLIRQSTAQTLAIASLSNKINSEFALKERMNLFDENHEYAELLNFVKESQLTNALKSNIVQIVKVFLSMKNSPVETNIHQDVQKMDLEAFKEYFKKNVQNGSKELEQFEEKPLVPKQLTMELKS